MSPQQFQDDLVTRLDSLSLPALATDSDDESVAIQSLESGILSKFLEFLSQYPGLLPDKQTVLAMLANAIDLAFTSLNKPIITSLLKPFVKAEILRIAGNLYDSILTPSTEV